MRKFLLLFLAILIHSFGKAQFIDNFSDGDFTSNPTWTGDAASYKINTAFQLQLNASGESISALSASNNMLQEMEWDFWAKLSFAPSDNNLARMYLVSDQADLKGMLNGYYIKLGETGSNDAIELVKQSGNIHTVVCRGTDGLLAASFAVRIKVIRSASGIWEVLADPVGGVNFQLQATGTDNSFTNGSFFGIYCKYTSSNSTKFYFDDFYAGQIIVDNTPPEVLSVSLTATNRLTLTFSEPVQNNSAIAINNYSVTPGALNPESASQDIANPSVINLLFTDSFMADVAYSLSISNVKDLAGNSMATTQFPFAWHKAKTFDLLINEIMADPSPPVNLPDAEYVELYNRSAYPVDLKDWTLLLGSSAKPLPQYTIPAGGYVILCDDGSKTLLEPFGPVLDFSSFAVTNAGGTITLIDFENNVIHSVSYTDKWYRSSYKFDGGWSLELIDPLNPCGEAANWIASNNPSGGTPGKLNSVNTPNPDLVAPTINRAGVSDATHIIIWFSESCDSTNIKNTANYSIDNGIGNPTTIDKLCAYADDIVFIIKDNCISLRNLFKTYHQFSKISGIELNTTKTEIMRIGDEEIEKDYVIEDNNGQEVQIKSIEAIKVCGITYSYNERLAYQANITDKVEKMESQLKRWLCRGLSLEGKIIIVKTFGLSQLIYFLQSCVITEKDIDLVNKLIFRFLWNKK